jgi:hypothetical protein
MVANITLIDAASNNKIRAKAPSLYVGEFKEANSKLTSSLKTHLIGGKRILESLTMIMKYSSKSDLLPLPKLLTKH